MSRFDRGGPIAWMTRNSVAANLLMALFLLGGVLVATRVKQEVFPEFTTDRISISVPYPGASPAEVEQGILLAVEDAVRGLDGVKEVTSNAFEGSGAVAVELLRGADSGKALQDVKNGIDRIQSFPEEAERPVVSLVEQRRKVLTVMVHGQADPASLRELAERIRDDLAQRDGITLVELGSAPPLEIAVEVPRAELRTYGITLDDVAREIRQGAIELPGGGVRTSSGEVLLRTQERRDYAREFEDIPVVARPDGTRVRLQEIATVRDTFAETDQEAFYNGVPAVRVEVYRVGDQTPQSVSDAVKEYLDEVAPEVPEGFGLAIWNDNSEIYRDRVNLLLRNFAIGLGLVLLSLGLFLDARLAFWVMLGIPISILGSFLFIPATGASINMISLFAFIVTLGIIVDDAVVVGENVYEYRQKGMPFTEAAIRAAKEISGPVVFAVLTNIAAFMPLFFVPGVQGNLFRQIPSVTVAVFAVSLIESLFILPAHLAHKPHPGLFWSIVAWPRRLFGRLLEAFIKVVYRPLLKVAIANRYATFAVALASLMVAGGLVGGGHVTFSFLPKLDADVVTSQARLPFGAPIEDARRLQARLVKAAEEVIAESGGDDIVRGIFTQVGEQLDLGGALVQAPGLGGAHLVGVQVFLIPTDERDVSSSEFSERWRERAGEIVGLESLTFTSDAIPATGAAVDVQLTHRDRKTLDTAASDLADVLATYDGVIDIDDGVSRGKPQMSFTIRPEARSLGLNALSVARQVRNSFYGAEALRQQRGRNEVKVLVRLPEEERRTIHTVEDLVLRTANGGEIPLRESVDVEVGNAYTEIRRRDGRRVVSVTGDVRADANANQIIAEVTKEELPALIARYPGLTYSLEGEQRDQREALGALGVGYAFAMLAIFGMLAIPFRSYIQPAIVMLAIPFGIIGAVIGHVILGYELSLISMFGVIALSGVVVNDSLVLVVTTNRLREEGDTPRDAVLKAGVRRFRPIILTSVTTFLGLAPMMLETSVQARFLIPMAISLGFGVIFSTLIILGLVPSVYLILEDLRRFARFLVGLADRDPTEPKEEAPAPIGAERL